MGLTKALWRELMMKKFMKKTKYLQWEEDKKMQGHRHRVRHMKKAVDDNLPNMAPKKCLEQKKERMARARMHNLESSNLWFLKRLRDIKNRKPGSLWRRKGIGLLRGDSYNLKAASAQMKKYKGKLRPPLKSNRNMKEHVVQKVVQLQGMNAEGEKWLRKWLSKDKDVPVDILDYSKARPSPRSRAKTPPPPKKGKKKVEESKEAEAEDLAPQQTAKLTKLTKLGVKDQQTETSPRTPLWEWDATPQPSSRWSGSRWASPRTPPSTNRWTAR